MKDNINRRELLKKLGISSLALGLAPSLYQDVLANEIVLPIQEDEIFTSKIIKSNKIQDNRGGTELLNGKVIAPKRELPVRRETDILVVGGGPAGVVAAIAAARTGVKVLLVERYGCFGGLWTGGGVPKVIGHQVSGPKQVCQGIGEEIMLRLDKIPNAIIFRGPGENPVADTEAAKYVLLAMLQEAGIDILLHSWAVDSIVEGNSVRGVVFESKSGRQAVLAKNVIDCTGDGDIFAAAGASFEHRLHHIGLNSRIGGVDTIDSAVGVDEVMKLGLGQPTPIPSINWKNMNGPDLDAINIDDLTTAEIKAREYIWNLVQERRKQPGFEKVFVAETASQLGVRISRILDGLKTIKFEDREAVNKMPDSIGVGGAGKNGYQIPYGALVPQSIDNILAAGRCVSTDMRSQDSVRLIPNCFVTGQGAGVAAALAVKDSCLPREVDIKKVQKVLLQQKAYLG